MEENKYTGLEAFKIGNYVAAILCAVASLIVLLTGADKGLSFEALVIELLAAAAGCAFLAVLLNALIHFLKQTDAQIELLHFIEKKIPDVVATAALV